LDLREIQDQKVLKVHLEMLLVLVKLGLRVILEHKVILELKVIQEH